MPQKSKYSNERFDLLTQDLISVLEKHQADRDLTLMALGNLVTNVFNHQVAPQHRQAMAEQFSQILLKSLDKAQTTNKE
ncbi:DUF1414 domain-containing protein [Bowmanella sp. Y26]|uniref:UPF0352 protein J0A65_18055 n=1 Tax=Bowmanella yangjiangensis TaxID=2811230 RepID=A0ABS3CXE2_9ALTE|nr:DUF1414 domain-containing protein [Bowmanella yangjiangensis]MBN7821778.1 DUF1414 domain-containing protein [Bowmanella yangjiangensis]MBT1063461.1 DUF1414 domain-containing protein [Bowmanella yangjiangensis]